MQLLSVQANVAQAAAMAMALAHRANNDSVVTAMAQSVAQRQVLGAASSSSACTVVAGSSGIVLVRVPNLGGVAVYAPHVDSSTGQVSIRAAEFVRQLVTRYHL